MGATDVRAKLAILADAAKKAGDTLGGEVEVVARGVVVGLGSHVSWDRKLDGRLAQALMSIPAIKAVGIGLGLEAARRAAFVRTAFVTTAPFTDDPDAALASLAAIEATGARWVLPGHGWPWKDGAAEAVRRVRVAAAAA